MMVGHGLHFFSFSSQTGSNTKKHPSEAALSKKEANSMSFSILLTCYDHRIGQLTRRYFRRQVRWPRSLVKSVAVAGDNMKMCTAHKSTLCQVLALPHTYAELPHWRLLHPKALYQLLRQSKCIMEASLAKKKWHPQTYRGMM